jgi:tripartite-type tricarboxylate transporter receptor subunit TctC
MPVHYKGGGETIKDLLSGEMKIMFSTIPPVLGFVKDGRLRGIATTGLKRGPALPELPTIAKAGMAGFDVPLWFGLAAPSEPRARSSRSWRRRSARRLSCRTSRRR